MKTPTQEFEAALAKFNTLATQTRQKINALKAVNDKLTAVCARYEQQLDYYIALVRYDEERVIDARRCVASRWN